MNKLFFVYLDWTLEEIPRCFYVGKGDDRRVRNKRNRNAKWRNVASKYGWRRETILSSKDPKFVEEQEQEWIARMGTFHFDDPNSCGCNFTRGGGSGCLGWKAPLEWVAARSGANNPMAKVKGEHHPLRGRSPSIESNEKTKPDHARTE